ncbi:MAG TPA: hypothetical protein VFZ52_00045 [Chryseolinea sp.]
MFSLIIAFQRKLVIPTFCLAVGIGIAGYFMVWSTPIDQGTGFGYFLAGPITHYFIYELRNENEYYFYFNKGLSKTILYCSTCTLNILIGGLTLSYA